MAVPENKVTTIRTVLIPWLFLALILLLFTLLFLLAGRRRKKKKR